MFMLLDSRTAFFHRLRQHLEPPALGLQYTAAAPSRAYNWAKDTMVSRKELLAENKKLTLEQMHLKSKLAKLLSIEDENQQLRALLSSSNKISDRVAVAPLLAISLDDSRALMVINAGSNKGLYVGQPVVDANGVVGQVVDLNTHLAKVMMVTDSASRVPVVDSRSHVRGVVRGSGSNKNLDLLNVLTTADIKVGDPMVTSGLGLHYPAGYPVATVASVKQIGHSGMKEVSLTPAASLDKSNKVMLIWHKQKQLEQQVTALLQDKSYAQHGGGAHARKG